MLLILNELYEMKGILSDAKLTQDKPSLPTSPTLEVSPTLPLDPLTEESQGSQIPQNISFYSPQTLSNNPPTTTQALPNSIPIASNLSVVGGRPVTDLTSIQQPIGMDPTAAPCKEKQIGPPPSMKSGGNLRISPFRR